MSIIVVQAYTKGSLYDTFEGLSRQKKCTGKLSRPCKELAELHWKTLRILKSVPKFAGLSLDPHGSDKVRETIAGVTEGSIEKLKVYILL